MGVKYSDPLTKVA